MVNSSVPKLPLRNCHCVGILDFTTLNLSPQYFPHQRSPCSLVLCSTQLLNEHTDDVMNFLLHISQSANCANIYLHPVGSSIPTKVSGYTVSITHIHASFGYPSMYSYSVYHCIWVTACLCTLRIVPVTSLYISKRISQCSC